MNNEMCGVNAKPSVKYGFPYYNIGKTLSPCHCFYVTLQHEPQKEYDYEKKYCFVVGGYDDIRDSFGTETWFRT